MEKEALRLLERYRLYRRRLGGGYWMWGDVENRYIEVDDGMILRRMIGDGITYNRGRLLLRYMYGLIEVIDEREGILID